MNVFSGKSALVIGGSGGIGAGICRKLYEHGAKLTIHGGHESKQFDKLIHELPGSKKIVYNFKSISDNAIEGESQRRVSDCIHDFMLLKNTISADILCVCFGPFLQKPLHQMSEKDWETVSSLDYMLPGILISSFLPDMIQKKWGRILLFGGTRTNFINGFKTNAAYGSAKTAVCSLVKSIALSYASFGITANAILPGFTDTEYVPAEQKLYQCSKMPDGKLISIETLAEASMFLLSHTEMNGVLLPVDSGWNPEIK